MSVHSPRPLRPPRAALCPTALRLLLQLALSSPLLTAQGGRAAIDRLENVTHTVSRILDGYDIRLRPNFGDVKLLLIDSYKVYENCAKRNKGAFKYFEKIDFVDSPGSGGGPGHPGYRAAVSDDPKFIL
ncbi:Gamma-aminobutyric acid receptor subunit beta-like [Eumeta japonica]|uniref:Gamma-aminobutyric acid receptor subunit beta-like n=1 Tax=Eumeta variegata TaxID=151549 RepID=A0A4C1TSY3_EUMVA|nr:Gamma-aminobutyric acid receptor subunit beta-like [Eumeta japonica]